MKKLRYYRWAYAGCSFLGLTPIFNFTTKKLYKRRLSNFFLGLFFINSLIAIIGVNFRLKNEYDTGEPLAALFLVQLPADYSYTFMPFIAIVMHFCEYKQWKKCMKNLLRIHESLDYVKYKDRYDLIAFIVFHLMEVVNVPIDFSRSLWQENSTLIYSAWYACYSINEFQWLYVSLTVNMAIHIIKTKYINLQLMLKEKLNTAIEYKFGNDSMEIDTIRHLKMVKFWVRQLSDSVKDINNMYGIYHVFLMLYTLVDVLDMLNSAIHNYYDIESNTLELMAILSFTFYLIYSCDSTSSESRKITKLCFDMEEKFAIDSSIREELLELAEHSQYYAPSFSLMGLIEINKAIVLSFISTLTTYLIVVLQFSSNF